MPVSVRLRFLVAPLLCGVLAFSELPTSDLRAQEPAGETASTAASSTAASSAESEDVQTADSQTATSDSLAAPGADNQNAATDGQTIVAPDPPETDDSGGGTPEADGLQAVVDGAFGRVNGFLASGMFYNVLKLFSDEPTHNIPLAVALLVSGAIFFTLRMGFINFRGFKHAILVTAGRYDSSHDHGEVSHFQALTAALSATVGLGNIAGVAIAIATGGPGATFWMIMAGLLGMSSKFVECTLGQKYREVRPDGHIMGGAMFYLSKGLKELGLGPFGKFLAVFFAILCIGGSFGGGCAFQVRQSLDAVGQSIPFLADSDHHWIYGVLMAVAVGVVIIGGIRSIARVAEKIVPIMCVVYVIAAIIIILMHLSDVPVAFSRIFSEAFNPQAVYGGFIGVLVTGFKRAAFSNEAGVGSAAIAHSAAKTEYPVREGIVALLEPFIDTVVICTMTALVIVLSGGYLVDGEGNPDEAGLPRLAIQDLHPESDPEMIRQMRDAATSDAGATLTSIVMDRSIPGFRFILGIAVVLFAYSTMISWSYYGERCWAYLFGDRASMSYRIIFLVFVVLGSIVSARNVLDFGDLMILGMAFPNIIGLFFLSNGVARDLKAYWQKYTSGEFDQKA
jgi:AGCS family alanine or glycine:cation symporter